jgi:hypothetical protein
MHETIFDGVTVGSAKKPLGIIGFLSKQAPPLNHKNFLIYLDTLSKSKASAIKVFFDRAKWTDATGREKISLYASHHAERLVNPKVRLQIFPY